MQPRTPRQMGLSNGKKRRLDAGDDGDDDDATGLGMSRGTVRHRMKIEEEDGPWLDSAGAVCLSPGPAGS